MDRLREASVEKPNNSSLYLLLLCVVLLVELLLEVCPGLGVVGVGQGGGQQAAQAKQQQHLVNSWRWTLRYVQGFTYFSVLIFSLIWASFYLVSNCIYLRVRCLYFVVKILVTP